MQKELFSHTVKIKPHAVVLVFHVCSANNSLRLAILNHARNRGKENEIWEFLAPFPWCQNFNRVGSFLSEESLELPLEVTN